MSSGERRGLDLIHPSCNPIHQSHHLPQNLSYRESAQSLQSSYQFSLLEEEGEDGFLSSFITQVKRMKTNHPPRQKRFVSMNHAPDLYHQFADMRPRKRESDNESLERENVGTELGEKNAKLGTELHSLNVWSDNAREMKKGSELQALNVGSDERGKNEGSDSGREMNKGSERSVNKRERESVSQLSRKRYANGVSIENEPGCNRSEKTVSVEELPSERSNVAKT